MVIQLKHSVQSGFNCGHSLLFLSSGNLMQVKQLLPQAPPEELCDRSIKHRRKLIRKIKTITVPWKKDEANLRKNG
uniref:Uncharacterized protein n=1 Tax=Solanum tuberosum TaxID=4113 RepID=M1CPT5_SOLTU